MTSPPASPDIAAAHARVAQMSRFRASTDPKLVDARRTLRAAVLEAHVRRVVDDAPPLTPEQRERIAAVLRVPAVRAAEPA